MVDFNSSKILFSILIPTKDRFELLKKSIRSVLVQDYKNWELIISDNHGNQNIGEWIERLNDCRIRYKWQPKELTVTDNWNKANDMARGDYIIMLGDDDALLPDALSILLRRIQEYNMPELVVFYAYTFTQPDVDTNNPWGSVIKHNPVIKQCEDSGYISRSDREKKVIECCQFENRFTHNMQYFCYSRLLCEKIKQYGDFYEPPYPDYYTSCMMLILSEQVVAISESIAVIGVTPKSYGCYYLNNNEKEGMEFHKEADYRLVAPKSVRRYLCSVDEMDTAAAATYALIWERLGEKYKVNVHNYYKAVLRRMISLQSMEEISILAENEIKPNITEKEYKDLLSCVKNCNINGDRESKRVRYLPWQDVEDFLSDFAFVRTVDHLADLDLYYWLSFVDLSEFRDASIYIWGAYYRGQIIREYLSDSNIKIKGYIDGKMKDNIYDSIRVYGFEDIPKENHTVIIYSMRHLFDEVIDTLNVCSFYSEDSWIYKRINI